MPRIAVLGTGIMGAPIARRLAAAGHDVTAWNRTRSKAEALADHGIRIVNTPSEAAAAAEFVIILVADGPACDELLFGDGAVAQHLSAGSVVVVMSSIPVETAEAQACRLGGLEIAYVDAPVSGGERGAIDGTLTIMAGGEVQPVKRIGSWIDALGRMTRIGEVGTGQLAKLANQAIVGITIGAVAEALLMVERAGGDPRAVLKSLEGGFADSRVLREHGTRMVNNMFEPGGRATLQLKDLRTALSFCRKLGLATPFIETATDAYARMCTTELAHKDHSALYCQLGRESGERSPKSGLA